MYLTKNAIILITFAVSINSKQIAGEIIRFLLWSIIIEKMLANKKKTRE